MVNVYKVSLSLLQMAVTRRERFFNIISDSPNKFPSMIYASLYPLSPRSFNFEYIYLHSARFDHVDLVDRVSPLVDGLVDGVLALDEVVV